MNLKNLVGFTLIGFLISLTSIAQAQKEQDCLYIQTITISQPCIVVFSNYGPTKSYRYLLASDSIINKVRKKDLTYDYMIKHCGYAFESPCYLDRFVLKKILDNPTSGIEKILDQNDSLCTKGTAKKIKLYDEEGVNNLIRKRKNVGVIKVNCDKYLLFHVKSSTLLKYWKSSHTSTGLEDAPNLFIPLVVPIIDSSLLVW